MHGQSNGYYLIICVLIFLAGVAWSADSIVASAANAATAVGTLLLAYFAYKAENTWFRQKSHEQALQVIGCVTTLYLSTSTLFSMQRYFDQKIADAKVRNDQSEFLSPREKKFTEHEILALQQRIETALDKVRSDQHELVVASNKLVGNRQAYKVVMQLLALNEVALKDIGHQRVFNSFNNYYKKLQHSLLPEAKTFDLPKQRTK